MDYFRSFYKQRKPIHLFKSIINDDYDSIEYLLNILDKEMYEYLYNEDDLTPLMLASKLNNYEILELLLEKDLDINVTNDEGKSSLHIACIEGHDDIVFLLLKNGADVNLLDNNSKSPIFYALQKGHLSVVSLFSELSNYDVNHVNDGNETSQHLTEPSNVSPVPSLSPE